MSLIDLFLNSAKYTALMKTLNGHSGIIPFLESFYTSDDQLVIVSDFVERGNLREFVEKSLFVEELEIREIIIQVCEAIKYIHEVA